jgi:putative ABC transport system permease protein
MFENIQLAFQGIWNHKLRSFLTMLGIIIGIACIITIVSTIKGTEEQIKQNLIGSGTNAVVVKLYQDDNAYEMSYSSVPDGVRVITEDTRSELAKLDNVMAVSLFHSRTYADSIFYQDTAFTGNVYGVDENYFSVYGYQICYGHNFTQTELKNSRKVVILDEKAASAVFAGKNPLGQTMEIRGEPFTVIGVVAQTDTFKPVIETMSDYYTYANTSSGSIFLPDADWPILYRYDEPQTVAIKASSTDTMTSAGKAVADALTERQIVDRSSKFSYRSEDMMEQAQQLQSLSNSTNKQLIWIAAISLLVAGIGVMNIMLVSVTERTSEIGLKKAIGAKKRRIMRQFLTEAAVLTSLGGILGVIAGIVLAKLLSGAMGTPTAISVPAILVAVLFSTCIGIIFGLLPATKAAKMNPIDALRRD